MGEGLRGCLGSGAFKAGGWLVLVAIAKIGNHGNEMSST